MKKKNILFVFVFCLLGFFIFNVSSVGNYNFDLSFDKIINPFFESNNFLHITGLSVGVKMLKNDTNENILKSQENVSSDEKEVLKSIPNESFEIINGEDVSNESNYTNNESKDQNSEYNYTNNESNYTNDSLNRSYGLNETNITRIEPRNVSEENNFSEEVEYVYETKRIVNSYFGKAEELEIKLKRKKIAQDSNYTESFKVSSISSSPVKYLEAEIENISIIRKINFKELELNDNFSLGVEKLNRSEFMQSYAIDPSNLDFANATITLVAKGENLYKCKDWNFSEQNCYGDWELYKTDLIPGEEYSFLITSLDPAFGEINISDAVHLDENKNFISNIFDEVKDFDNVWSEPIYHGEYVRVAFKENLTNEKDITVYVRNNESTSTTIEVYYYNSSTKITEFQNIDMTGEYKVYLSNMVGGHSVFDLKVVNNESNSSAYLEFDYIVDPTVVNFEDWESYGDGDTTFVNSNWSNVGGDNCDWQTDSGGTPSFSTGPSVDHTLGTGSGNYLYMEVSSGWCQNPNPGSTSIIESDDLDADTNNYTIDFWYHMYGSTIGTLSLEVDNGTANTTVWSLTGAQGDTWYNQNVNLGNYTGTIKLRFKGVQAGQYFSDFALDDINITSELRNTAPSVPTNITCDGGNCNNTFADSVNLNCSGSVDSDGDNITYFIDACYQGGVFLNSSDFGLLAEPAASGGIIVQEGTAEGVTAAIGGTALSYNYALQQASGNDRLLVVQVVWEDSATTSISSLTYNGIAMDEATSVTVGTGYSGFTSIYYLNDSNLPSTAGSYNLSVITADSVTNDIYMTVIEYSGVEQSVPDDTNTAINAGAGDISVDLTASYDNSVLIVAGMSGGTTTMNGAESGDVTNVQWQDLTSSTGAIATSNLTLSSGSYSGGWTGLGTRSAAVGAIWHAQPTESSSNETNTSYVTYENLSEPCDSLTNLTFIVEIDSYDPSASVEQSTNYPDLELSVWNSTDWVFIGEFDLNETYTGSDLNTTNYNFTLSTDESSIMSSWLNSTNQDFRIRAVYMDWYNSSVVDEINYTNVYVDIDANSWHSIGNHSEDSTFNWSISNLEDQTDVDLRCRAIDIDGKNEYSDYFGEIYNLTITTPSEISILSPLDGQTYNFVNLTLRTNITQGTPDSCWYGLNGVNTSFNCGTDVEINAVEGKNNLTAYVNNSYGFLGLDSITFFVNSSKLLIISITSPENNTFSNAGSPKLNLSANDLNYSLVNYSVFIYYENDTLYAYGNNGTLTSGVEAMISVEPFLILEEGVTTYKIIVNASDAGGNIASSNILYYNLISPSISLISPLNNYWSDNGNVTFEFNVDHETVLNLSCLLYINNTLNQTNSTVFVDSLTSFDVKGIVEGGNNIWKIECTDVYNNIASDFRYFNVDKTPPVINWANYTTIHTHENGTMNFTANITDNIGLDYVMIDINGTSYYMSDIGNDVYFYNYDIFLPEGTYNYTIYAYDNSENNATYSGNFTLLAISVDVTDLRPIANTTYNETLEIEIAANVTTYYTHNISFVFANVTYPSGEIEQVVLNNVSGDKYNTSYTIPYIKGRYNVTFFANDSYGVFNDTETTYFILEDAGNPLVEVIYLLSTFDEYSDVTLTLNITDLSPLDLILANITSPNGTNYLTSDFSDGMHDDNFSLGDNHWLYEEQYLASNHSCSGDINETYPGKMFISINGTGDSGETYCGYNGKERIDGNFDMNITFNVTHTQDDALFLFRSSNLRNFQPEGSRAYLMLRNEGGTLYYNYGYDNGTETISNETLGESYGKFRIKRFNFTENESYYNLFYWNNTNSSWVDVFGNISVPNSLRAQFVQIYAVSLSEGYGEINITVDDFYTTSNGNNFTIFNDTSESGMYNVSFFVNDTLGNVNDTEETSFYIFQINEQPSRPFISNPSSGAVVNALYNITWTAVNDDEDDSLQFNITLLNVNESVNYTIITNYGDFNSNFYMWNSSEVLDGEYKIEVTVFENETAEGYSNSDISNVFSVENTGPSVKVIYPLNRTFDTNFVVTLEVNATDVTSVDKILANITMPNNVSYLLNDFVYPLQSDDFENNTEDVNWFENIEQLSTGQNCTLDIDTTYEDKMFLSINGTGSDSNTYCGFNSKRVNGDFDANITFNASLLESDSIFSFRINNKNTFLASGTRVWVDIQRDGELTYSFGYSNASQLNEEIVSVNETFGKFRIRKFNETLFNLYYWNSSNSSWIMSSLGTINLTKAQRSQFVQFGVVSMPSLYGNVNVTLDGFYVDVNSSQFTVFNETSVEGVYNISYIVNDTLGNVNNTEIDSFNILEINDYPSRPFLSEPDPGEVFTGIENITWAKVYDEENDSLRFNISLLNTDGSFNSTIVTEYGNINSTYYEWNTFNFLDGVYKLSITVYQNETENDNAVTDDTDGNITIDNTPPKVQIVYPLSHTFNVDEVIALTLNLSDSANIDSIIANVTIPNGSSNLVSDFLDGIFVDSFDSDTLGVYWEKIEFLPNNQTCVLDINNTVPGKMFLAVNGTGFGTDTTSCGFDSRRVDGNFDVNISFNISFIEDDALFLFRSNNLRSPSASGVRALLYLEQKDGIRNYVAEYNNDSGFSDEKFFPTNDTEGKFRIKRSNMTGTPVFNLYFWNSTNSSWVDTFGNLSFPETSRTQFIELEVWSSSSNFGLINVSVDDFFMSGDNYTFAMFNQTNSTGVYNVSFEVNDTAGNLNDTENTDFSIAFSNTPPSEPTLTEPDPDEIVSGVFNITWGQVSDSENDSLKFNITLLNTNGSFNSTIVSNYGNSSSTYYMWNTTPYLDGNYSMSVTVYENETAEGYSDTDTLLGNFTIDNTAPYIEIISPENILYGNAIVLVNITSDGENVWFYNGTDNETYTVPVYREFSEGVNTLYAWANDTSGNLNSTFVNFTVDLTGPNVWFENTSTSIGPQKQDWIFGNFSANDSLSDISSITIYLNNETDLIMSVINFSSNFYYNFTNLTTNNIYYIKVSANDSVGNVENSSSRFVFLDLDPPEFTNLANQIIMYGDSLAYDIDAVDSEYVGVDCFSVNDTSNFNINCTGYLTNATNLSVGIYWLNVSVNDTLGNEGSDLMYVNVTYSDSCTYPGSGNWEINCSDNCTINSDVDMLGNSISIIGTGSFTTNSNITNFSDLYIQGDSSVDRCNVYCVGGGCFV